MTTYRKIELKIVRTFGYGQYQIQAMYKGKLIKVHTTDAECFDWLDDDSNKAKHQRSKRHAYNQIVNAYQSQR